MLPNAFGTSSLSITTSDSYAIGDLITISGSVLPPSGNQAVAIEVKDSSNQSVLLRTVQTSSDGSFELKFKTPASANSGIYTIVANAFVDGEKITKTREINVGSGSPAMTAPEKKNGCLIATAAFGSELAPQVQILRETRDNIVMQTKSGASFMTSFNSVYYTFAPTIADWERQNPVFKEMVKITITPLLTTLSILNYVEINSEAEMLGYGIGVILLNLGMYFVAPAFVIMKVKRHYA